MKVLRVELQGHINSFRVPQLHTYQKTLPLPPKTTIVGLLGAALGVSEGDIPKLLEALQVSVIAREPETWGFAKDLWRYLKFMGGTMKATTTEGRDIVVRELLYRPAYWIYLTSQEPQTLTAISQALSDPAWALTLGREDELVLIQSVEEIELEPTEMLSFQNTILPYNVYQTGFEVDRAWLAQRLVERARLVPPEVHNLPTTFVITKKGREPENPKEFTFVHNLRIGLKSRPIADPGPWRDGKQVIELF
jgi:CRISPR-associated protein Cas5t